MPFKMREQQPRRMPPFVSHATDRSSSSTSDCFVPWCVGVSVVCERAKGQMSQRWLLVVGIQRGEATRAKRESDTHLHTLAAATEREVD